MFKRIIQRWFYLICLSISDKGHCQCFTEKGQLARNNTPFPIFMRTRLIHPKRSFVPRHSVISPHDDTLSFCSYGLLHCMCIGTNFSTWIKHADEVFLNHSGIPYFKAHLPSIKRGRGVLETNDGYILFCNSSAHRKGAKDAKKNFK